MFLVPFVCVLLLALMLPEWFATYRVKHIEQVILVTGLQIVLWCSHACMLDNYSQHALRYA